MTAQESSRFDLTYYTFQALHAEGSLSPSMSPSQVQRIVHDLEVFFLDRCISIPVATSILHVFSNLLPRHFSCLLLSFRGVFLPNMWLFLQWMLKVTVDSFEKDLYLQHVSYACQV